MGAPAVQPTLIECLINQGKGDYTSDYLALETGLLSSQIRPAMNKIVQDGKLSGLTVISRGRVWRYDPSAMKATDPEDGPLWYQEIGRTGKGNVLVKGEHDQTLYVLTPLDV